MRVLIIGAGPCGLGAARELRRLGIDGLVLEAEPQAGGLSASFLTEDGFTWDLGGHVIFSHYDAFDAMLGEVMGPGAWCEHRRRSYIRVLDRWIPYPFQNNIHRLPDAARDECLEGLREARRRRDEAPPRDFLEWIARSAGAGIARLFLVPYNTKVWAFPPEQLSTSWVGARVALPDPDRIEALMKSGRSDEEWGPNRRFRFPRRGGTGAIWRSLAAALPRGLVLLGARVVAVDPAARAVRLEDGGVERYDRLVSTAPLDRLLAMAGLAKEGALAQGLLHNSVHVVGIGAAGVLPPEAREKTWLYFPEADYPFYRVTVFSAYSPLNAPPGHYSLMAEVAESSERPVDGTTVERACIAGLVRAGLLPAEGAVVHTWRRRIERAYPVPTLGRDAILDAVLPGLEGRGIYSRGRFGAWTYEVGNMDHCFAQGAEAVRRLALGEPEVTLADPAQVNRRRGGPA